MADIEKVIYDIERCICHVPDACRDCSHYGFDRMECMESLLKDALELLKERVKTKVVFGRTKDGEFVTECGNCGTYLNKAYSNCPKCKKELDWNSCQS